MSDELEQEIIPEEDKGGMDDKVKRIKEQLNQCQKEKQEYLTGWQRSQADFINFRRRQEEQMTEWSKMLGEGLVRDLLPVLDALEMRNLTNAETEGNKDKIKAGLDILRVQLMKVLNKHGLEEIKAVGEKFNPEFHEAMEHAESDAPAGTIVEEVQKGYTLNGKVIRASKVKVNK